MSLFNQLRRLYRPDRFQLEDFHTEIVAQVLRNSPALTLAWLKGIDVTSLGEADHIQVDTQKEFAKLAPHSMSSRPDITIRLVSGARKELVFVESKQDSTQGDDQLQRYADHLHAVRQQEGLDQVSLVFITRDYESAEMPQCLGDASPLNFQRARWFQFYRYLKVHVNSDGLARELKLFMQENHMSLGNQFRSTDLVALESFFSAKALMDETLEGEVSRAMEKLPGGSYSVRKCMTYFRDDRLYAASNGNWNDIECYVGYWLPHENPDEPVWVGITIYSNPSSSARKDVVDAFRDWSRKASGGWSIEEIDDESAKSALYKGKSLQTLMGEPDHVRTIKDYFLGLLEELEVFHKAYPKVPWARQTRPIGNHEHR